MVVETCSVAAHGAVTQYQMGNNVWHNAGYNSRLQMSGFTDAVNHSNNSILLTASLNWGSSNNNGNLQNVSYNNGGPGYPSFVTFNQSFTYDGLNRLKTATDSGGWSRSFAYDAYGNMTPSGTPAPPSVSFTTNNQIVSAPYDQAGNLTSVNGNTLGHDFESRIVSETDGVSKAVETYVFDGNGNRVEKYGPSGAGKSVFVYDALGRMAAEYTNFSETPNCLTCYLTPDHLGTARVVTDQGGNVVARHDYLPFGEEVAASQYGRDTYWGLGSDTVHQKFTGKERDSESGLDYFGARYYGSGLGRFSSPDPSNLSVDFWLPQTWNRYTYGLNNPLTMVDKNGLWPSPIHFLMNDSSFPGMSKKDIEALDKATWGMDWAPGQQAPRNAPQHGMQDGSDDVGGAPGTMQEIARQAADDFISQQVSTAQQAQADWKAQGHTGIAPAALTAFGNALHTVQDRTSPARQGEQPWTDKTKDVPGHLWRERWPSNDQWTAGRNASRTLFHRTFGNEFDWMLQKAPCASTSVDDGLGNKIYSGCQ